MSARTLEDLSFGAVPVFPATWSIPSVVTQLNLFAGQLYLRSYEEYEIVCRFLGLCCRAPGPGVKAACDSFIEPDSRVRSDSALIRGCSFTTSPVAFLRTLMALRRKGQT